MLTRLRAYATLGGSVVTVVGWGVRWPAMKFGQCWRRQRRSPLLRCQRERAILLFLCGAGLRAGELVALNAEDIDVAAGIVSGSGRERAQKS